jgi:hypothetical protein
MNDYTISAFWNKEREKQKLQHFIEQRISTQILKNIRLRLFKGAKIFEIGCLPARRLYYLQEHFQMQIYGLD